MKFSIEKKYNTANMMRKIGYHFKRGPNSSFYRPLDRNDFPRFHIYLKENENNIIFNLHLDQKRPVYNKTTAHSGEYDSDIVEKEAQRIKDILR